MPKFDYAKLSLKQREEIIGPLFKALATLEQEDQLRDFLTKLLTPSELIMLGRRLQVGERLVAGKSYENIRKELGVGFSTIQGVDSWLEHAVRDYHDIRAARRAEEQAYERQKHSGKYRYRRAYLPLVLVDLLVDAYAIAEVSGRGAKRGKKINKEKKR